MHTFSPRLLALLALAAFAPAAVLHAAPEKYQVTGPIIAMDATTVTVMKGKEKFVMARDAATKMTGGAEPKVGDKVTVQYTITATDVEVKPDAKAKAGTVKKESNKPAKDAPMAPTPAAAPTPAGVR